MLCWSRARRLGQGWYQGGQSRAKGFFGHVPNIEAAQDEGHFNAKAQFAAMLEGAQEALGQIIAQGEAAYGGGFQVGANFRCVGFACLPVALQAEADHAVHLFLHQQEQFAAAGLSAEEARGGEPASGFLPPRRVGAEAVLLALLLFALDDPGNGAGIVADRQPQRLEEFDDAPRRVALAQRGQVFPGQFRARMVRAFFCHDCRLLGIEEKPR